MSNLPLVSIVMAAYNAEKWVGASLDACLAQTHRPLEIIVVDDGSSDGTPAILADYARVHGIRVLTQANRGQSAALNAGVAAATGRYIKFVDADDLIDPENIAVQVAALSAHPRHLAYGVWGRFYTDPAETVFTPHPGWHDSDHPADWLCETWEDTEPMYQCALFLIPRELLTAAGGWDERLSLINDFEFFTRLVLVGEGIRHTPAARLRYRSNLAGSLSAQKSRRAWESACLSTRLAVKHLLAKRNDPEARRLAAGMLKQLVFAIYPAHHDLTSALLNDVARLGGSSTPLNGGRLLRLLARVCGWRLAIRLRDFRQRRSSLAQS
jgi:glycosyltransferase involved in cell wall biosynthesis